MKITIRKMGIGILTLMLLFMNFASIPALRTTNKENLPQPLMAPDNILADITVTWESFFHRFSLKDIPPTVTIHQNEITDFYFPEVNGTIPYINFSVVCKHRLNHTTLLPRFTQVYITLLYNGTYILLNESENHRCQSQDWEYINLTVESQEGFIPLPSNGQNMTLTAEVGAYFFFFGYWGTIETLSPITIHPYEQ